MGVGGTLVWCARRVKRNKKGKNWSFAFPRLGSPSARICLGQLSERTLLFFSRSTSTRPVLLLLYRVVPKSRWNCLEWNIWTRTRKCLNLLYYRLQIRWNYEFTVKQYIRLNKFSNNSLELLYHYLSIRKLFITGRRSRKHSNCESISQWSFGRILQINTTNTLSSTAGYGRVSCINRTPASAGRASLLRIVVDRSANRYLERFFEWYGFARLVNGP